MFVFVELVEMYIEIGKMAAEGGTDVVVLIDRGLMDGSAYVSKS